MGAGLARCKSPAAPVPLTAGLCRSRAADGRAVTWEPPRSSAQVCALAGVLTELGSPESESHGGLS